MYRRILFCYDGTAEGRRALRQGGELAAAMKAHTHVLAICRSMVTTVVPEGVTPELIGCEEDTARALLNEGVQKLRDHGLSADGSLVFGDPLVHIPETARRIQADLIVLGYRPRSRVARWWSQSEQQSLLERVPCSVLVAMDTSA